MMSRITLFISALLASFITFSAIGQVGTVTRIAGVPGTWDVSHFNGDGLADTLTRMYGISCFIKDNDGNIIVADQSNRRIRKIDHSTHIVTTIVGTGSLGISTDGLPGPLTALAGDTYGLAVDDSGNVIFGDHLRIRKFNKITGIVTTIAGGGTDTGNNIPATSAALIRVVRIFRDVNGDIYFSQGHALRVLKAATNNIVTVAGTIAMSGFSGDGGPALNALFNYIGSITKSPDGSIYIGDTYNYRLRKIDTAGVVTTVSGTGNYQNIGDGGPAANASWAGIGIVQSDASGNLYVGGGDGNGYSIIRRIDKVTGIINKVANIDYFFMLDTGGTVLYSDALCIFRLSSMYCPIKTMSVADTMFTPQCQLPAQRGFAIHGTINGVPGPTDSVVVTYSCWGRSIIRRIPYHIETDPGTGASVYTFGDTGYWFHVNYALPTQYNGQLSVRIGNYLVGQTLQSITARSACDSNVNGSDILSYTDTITTGPCVAPVNVKSTVEGIVYTETGVASVTDSVYVVVEYLGDEHLQDTFVVPVGADNRYHCVFNHAYTPLPSTPERYRAFVTAFTNNGIAAAQTDMYTESFSIAGCDDSLAYSGVWADGGLCGFSVPFTGTIHFYANLFGAATNHLVYPVNINFGDGSDTTIILSKNTDWRGHYSLSADLHHNYEIAGSYDMSATIDTSILPNNDPHSYTLTLDNSCSPLSGVFYIDVNHNCVADPGETRLAYWPFLLVNTTTGDTVNAWADLNGNYSVALHDSNSYSLIPTHATYYEGSSGDSLTVSCPATGVYSVTAAAGSVFTQDIGFTCAGVAGSVDMSVSGWGWGFVPGDTGIIAIWSSDAWGYMCDSVSSSITLTIDPHLSYLGMWNGPEPTTVAGNVLTWNFSTTDHLFDFTANVKVFCDTTATMLDTAVNTLYIAPTTLTDPNIANNTYTWRIPIRTSWDPNEKDVSPKGFGPEGYIENGTPLSYMVHFQNSGTAPARNITIVDTITDALDLSTLQVINSSAPVIAYQVGSNTVKFRFANINLPDSTSDPEGSKGFVSFNILPKDNLPAGTQIQNTANIYFDYNPAVVTNTTLNTIEDSVRMITGTNQVCVEGAITLSNALAGGIWSSTNGNATVSATGVVSGVHPGTDTIVYTMYGDKSVYKTVEILAAPDPGMITGSNLLCTSGTTTLTSTVTGGIWSSSTGAAAVTGGIVTGVATGSVIISYTVTNSCGTASDTMQITINTLPDAGTVTGSNTVCVAASTTLSATIAGGVWSSSGSSATVVAGMVTGISAGAATISYAVTNNCGTATATKAMTVDPLPDAGTITGIPSVCASSTVSLSNATSGGTWSSSSSAATVVGGLVAGVTAGSSVISYSVTNICGTATDTMLVTINPLPDAGTITGINNVCPSASTTLANAATGGTWSSSSSAATVVSGVVAGASAGTAIISYSVTNICGTATDTMLFTVNPLPEAGTITGVNHVCPSASTTLTNAVAGGTWGSSTSAATVTGGIVTGASAGTTIISYSVTNICGTATDTMMVTVNPLPDAGIITGTPSICQAAVTTLTNTTTGGTWSSSSSAATVAGGLVTGASAGAAIISYSVTNICGTATDTMLFTVNPLPDAGTIAGVNNVCPSASTTLTNVATGGTWSSSSSAATVTGGIVTGASAGTAIISYSVTNICGTATDTMLLTVNPLPDAGTITGITAVCPSATATLTNAVAGGSWSSSSTSATVAGGLVTGVTAGTAIISYSVTNICGTATDTLLLTVNPSPDAGSVSATASHLCVGAVEVIDITVAGGSWTSSNPAVGLTDTGVIANSPGSSLISYSVTNVCGTATDTMTITVDALPDAGSLSGSATVCVGATISLTTSVTGGAWSATNSLLTITSAGDITGVATGTDTVLYTVSGTCGTDTAMQAITVATAPLAAAISGADSICEGATLSLTASTGGGTWSSSDAGILSVTTGGVITANAPGLVTISYALTSTCGTTTTTHNVYVIPAADCNNGIAGTGNISQPITIYPNPSSGTFMVQIPGAVNNATITVTDVSGKVLQVLHPQPDQHLTQVSLTNQASGTYMVKVEADGRQYRDKLVLW
jgi:hypothetical protein